MSSSELAELKGTLARDSQRAQQPLNLFFAQQQRIRYAKNRSLDEDFANNRKPPQSCNPKEAKQISDYLTRQISKCIEKIQDSRLPRAKLEELNTEINELISERYLYESKVHQGNQTTPPPMFQYFGAYKAFRAANAEDSDKKITPIVPPSSASHTIVVDAKQALGRRMTPLYYGVGSSFREEEIVALEAKADD
eukprot:PhF_6_TR34698/c0_g1_i2/m.50495/K12870/ISY1; pre-mRNA-splicing factor ISY1